MPILGLRPSAEADALRLYVALGDELDESGRVIAAGINCLNESATITTTPCLAWNLLFEERGLMWGCEADLVSMMTEFIVHKSLGVPVMMSNLYPFLMGDAALKHEKIPYFPDVDQPHDHILVAHCGYFGLVPQSFASSWALRPARARDRRRERARHRRALSGGPDDDRQARQHAGHAGHEPRRAHRLRAVRGLRLPERRGRSASRTATASSSTCPPTTRSSPPATCPGGST